MQKLTWKDVENAVEDLADVIRANGFRPDYIIGITTGGLFSHVTFSKGIES